MGTLYIGHLCDNGCRVLFDKLKVSVHYNKKLVFDGQRDMQTGLWKFDLLQSLENTNYYAILSYIEILEPSANFIIPQTTREKLMHFLHAEEFSITKSTLLKAIKIFFATWPGFTLIHIKKYIHAPDATLMGYMDH